MSDLLASVPDWLWLLLVLAFATADFAGRRVVYWQRKHIEALTEGLKLDIEAYRRVLASVDRLDAVTDALLRRRAER